MPKKMKTFKAVVEFKSKVTVEVEAKNFEAAYPKALKAANKEMIYVMKTGNFHVAIIGEKHDMKYF